MKNGKWKADHHIDSYTAIARPLFARAAPNLDLPGRPILLDVHLEIENVKQVLVGSVLACLGMHIPCPAP
jgi:hypothetical protein